MVFTIKTVLVCYCLTASLAVYVSGNKATEPFDILRGEHDTFRNKECQEHEQCRKEQCEKYGANCEDVECKRCQCEDGKNTFLAHTADGNCTADEMVVAESGTQKPILCLYF